MPIPVIDSDFAEGAPPPEDPPPPVPGGDEGDEGPVGPAPADIPGMPGALLGAAIMAGFCAVAAALVLWRGPLIGGIPGVVSIAAGYTLLLSKRKREKLLKGGAASQSNRALLAASGVVLVTASFLGDQTIPRDRLVLVTGLPLDALRIRLDGVLAELEPGPPPAIVATRGRHELRIEGGGKLLYKGDARFGAEQVLALGWVVEHEATGGAALAPPFNATVTIDGESQEVAISDLATAEALGCIAHASVTLHTGGAVAPRAEVALPGEDYAGKARVWRPLTPDQRIIAEELLSKDEKR